MRLLSVDFDGRDESLYIGDRTPALCEVFGSQQLFVKVLSSGDCYPLEAWCWAKGGCARVKPAPRLNWKPLPRLRRGVAK